MEKRIFPLTDKEAKLEGVTDKSQINKDATFPTMLRNKRKEKGYSQAQLGKLIGVTKSSIGLYETGDNVPDIRTFHRLASALEVSYNYLFGEDEFEEKGIEEIRKRLGLSSNASKVLENMVSHTSNGVNASDLISIMFESERLLDFLNVIGSVLSQKYKVEIDSNICGVYGESRYDYELYRLGKVIGVWSEETVNKCYSNHREDIIKGHLIAYGKEK